MSHEAEVHEVQTKILKELLFVDGVGFAYLQKATGLESDHFKFHIKRLVDLGYVTKQEPGCYALTNKGKEYANKLDTDKSVIEKQPKSSVILVIEKDGKFVVQERLKHPYFGFYGFPGGKIRWGETIMEAGARELMEETGLQATLSYRGVYHEHVIENESGQFLEDKIFHVIYGKNAKGNLITDFEGGRNVWMTLKEAYSQEKRYASFDIEAEVGMGKKSFVEATQYYSKNQF